MEENSVKKTHSSPSGWFVTVKPHWVSSSGFSVVWAEKEGEGVSCLMTDDQRRALGLFKSTDPKKAPDVESCFFSSSFC